MKYKAVSFLAMFCVLGCAELDAADDSASAASERHCAVDTDTQETQCFSSLQDSVAFATHGLIADAAEPEEVRARIAGLSREKRGGSLGAGSSSVLAILYEHENFHGATFIFFGTRCEGQVPRLEDYGMGDRVTSYQTFQGCALTLWKHVRFGGLRLTTAGDYSDLGGYSDVASSARVHYLSEEQISL
jgi:hypothetical protein